MTYSSLYPSICLCLNVLTFNVIVCGTEGSARPLFPQWSHHVYPQFLPGSHPNAAQHQHSYVRHRHSYIKHHYNLNNNHHSHHHNHKIDHRYHRNSISSHAGNLTIVLQYRTLLSLLMIPRCDSSLIFESLARVPCNIDMHLYIIRMISCTYSCLEMLAVSENMLVNF